MPQAGPSLLDTVDHVALSVDDVGAAVDWYTRTFRCAVEYQNATWALVRFANLRVAFVSQGQHPPHIGLRDAEAERFGPLKPHRDGTRSVYIADPSGNAVEILKAE